MVGVRVKVLLLVVEVIVVEDRCRVEFITGVRVSTGAVIVRMNETLNGVCVKETLDGVRMKEMLSGDWLKDICTVGRMTGKG